MRERLRFLLSRLRERLWIKPLFACALSVAGVLLAHLADRMVVDGSVPEVTQASVIELLKIIAAGMLAVATFAVASMVSAYASAGQIATARAFPLIVADDVSQNALSTFVGAFIFSVVGISAAMNGYYGRAGRFTLFVLMVVVLVIVVLTFVRWVDRIARLGRIGAIVDKVERATAAALARRLHQPRLGGVADESSVAGVAIHSDRIGYVQHIDMARLQRLAADHAIRVGVAVLPGAYVTAAAARPAPSCRPVACAATARRHRCPPTGGRPRRAPYCPIAVSRTRAGRGRCGSGARRAPARHGRNASRHAGCHEGRAAPRSPRRWASPATWSSCRGFRSRAVARGRGPACPARSRVRGPAGSR
ncbi:hypothetical protein GCM10025794_18480 [Massilia kyonggiensis]